jgi:hypothetical protein
VQDSLPCLLKVLGSNIGQDNDYPD